MCVGRNVQWRHTAVDGRGVEAGGGGGVVVACGADGVAVAAAAGAGAAAAAAAAAGAAASTAAVESCTLHFRWRGAQTICAPGSFF